MTEDQNSDRRNLLRQALDAIEGLKAKLRSHEEPIAIVGAGCRFPGGAGNLDQYWQLLMEGRDAVEKIPMSRWEAFGQKGASPDWSAGLVDGLENFDASFFRISAREAASMDPQQRMLLEVVWQALENAAQPPAGLVGSKTGVFIGITGHDYADLLRESGGSMDVYAATGNANNAAAGRISFVLGLQGPSVAIDTACSSSLVAIHLACQSLRNKESDLAVAGGVNTVLTAAAFECFYSWGMMSPEGRCKAFDSRADGFVRGEGCGIVVLKRLSDALANQDRILALIRGSAVNQDGRSSGLTVPNGPAQEAVIRQALAAGRVNPADIDYVEAHGTGTALGDPIESYAIGSVLGAGRPTEQKLIVGSVKSNIGHLESASGVAGLIKTVLSLRHQTIPANLHFRQLNPNVEWAGTQVEIPVRPHPWPRGGRKRLAGVSGFGFSGTNAHLVIEEAPDALPRNYITDQPLHVFTASAQTDEALMQLLDQYRVLRSDEPFADLCFTASAGRNHFERRVALCATSLEDLQSKLPKDVAAFSTVPREAPRLAFLFSGQGSQYPAMGNDLFETQPVFRSALEECDAILRKYLEHSLLDVLYGESSARNPGILNQTAYTQPALFSLEWAVARLWESWGVVPQAVCGHSVGEYAAATFAGFWTLEDGLHIMAERGRLMQSLGGSWGMLAARCKPEVVEPLLQAELSIAAVNGPENLTLSGRTEQLDGAEETLRQLGVAIKRLPVSHAFHSAQMDPIAVQFAALAASMPGHAPRLPLISSVTGRPLDRRTMADPAYWRQQVRQPVQFQHAMQTLHELGMGAFLEIGPGATLIGLGRACVPQNSQPWLASMRAETSTWEQLGKSISHLYLQGITIDWAGFHQPYSRRRIALPSYPFERQRHWIPAAKSSSYPARLQAIVTSGHPLLGERLDSAHAQDQITWQTTIDLGRLPYLADHCVQGIPLVPATVYLEIATAVAHEVFDQRPVSVIDAKFLRPLFLPAGAKYELRISYQSEAGSPAGECLVYARLPDSPDWILHAKTKVAADPDIAAEALPAPSEADFAAWQTLETGDFYRQSAEQGNQWGPSFRGLDRIWLREKEAWSHGASPDSVGPELPLYFAHPAIADACGHTLVALANFGDLVNGREGAFVGESIGRVTLFAPVRARRMWTRARIRPSEQEDVVYGDVSVFDEEGVCLSALEGARLRFLPAAGSDADPKNWHYRIAWREVPEEAIGKAPDSWFVLSDSAGFGKELARRILADGHPCEVLEVAAGSSPFDWQRWLDNFRAGHPGRSIGVVNCLGLDLCASESESTETTVKRMTDASGAIASIQSIACASPVNTRLWVVTCGAQSTSPQQELRVPEQAALWGFGRVFASEHPELWGALVDLCPLSSLQQNAEALWRHLLSASMEDQVALRGQSRLAARLERTSPPKPSATTFRKDASYLITGGLGALGLEVARWMAQSGARRLVLFSRTPLPPRSEWLNLDPASAASRTVQALREIENLGSTVYPVAIDVSDTTALANWFAHWTQECNPPIRGVIHAAGILTEAAIADMPANDLAATLCPKVAARSMYSLAQPAGLDFFVMFSSGSAILGAPRLGAYSASNAFIDGFANQLQSLGQPGTSIAWGLWQEGRMGNTSTADAQSLSRRGAIAISSAAGLDALGLLLKGHGATAVLPIMWQDLALRFPQLANSPFLRDIFAATGKSSDPMPSRKGAELLAIAEERRVDRLVAEVTNALGAILGIAVDRLDPQAPLSRFGLDSLTAIELRNRILEDTGVSLQMVRFLQEPTIMDLAKEILDQLTPKGALPGADNLPANASSADKNFAHLSESEIDAAIRDLRLDTAANIPGNFEAKRIFLVHALENLQAFPLTRSQRSLWFLHKLVPASTAYNTALGLRLLGELDSKSLETALDKLLDRHPALRTSVFEVGDEPYQRANQSIDTNLPIIDLSTRRQDLECAVADEYARPFDLGVSPFRATLFRVSALEHLLVLVVHHIAFDAWSAEILFNELQNLYGAGIGQDQPALNRLNATHAEWAQAEQALLSSPAGERLSRYWADTISTQVAPLWRLDRRLSASEQEYGAIRYLFDNELTARIRAFTAAQGATLFHVMLAALQALLHHRSGREKVLVGTPVSGRQDSRWNEVVGYFVNLLPIVTAVDPDISFIELLQRTRTSVFGAFEHQAYPYSLIVERSRAQRGEEAAQLVQVMFNLVIGSGESKLGRLAEGLDNSGSIRLGDAIVEGFPILQQQGQFPLVIEMVASSATISGMIKWSPQLFDADKANRFAREYVQLLQMILVDPDTPLHNLLKRFDSSGTRDEVIL